MKIAVIGAGSMGGTLIEGWCKAGLTDRLAILARTQKTLDGFAAIYPSLHTSLSNCEVVRNADMIVPAVKPWLVNEVIEELAAFTS